MQTMYYTWFGCSQEDDQLLREGSQWRDSRRGNDSRDTF